MALACSPSARVVAQTASCGRAALAQHSEVVRPPSRAWPLRLTPSSLHSGVLSTPASCLATRRHTEVYLGGALIGKHDGGYDGFGFDVTDHFAAATGGGAKGAEGVELVVGVFDPTENGDQPHGKQSAAVSTACMMGVLGANVGDFV